MDATDAGVVVQALRAIVRAAPRRELVGEVIELAHRAEDLIRATTLDPAASGAPEALGALADAITAACEGLDRAGVQRPAW